MTRTIITLIGSVRKLAARQILLSLNMNRIQNAISSANIQEVLSTAQSRENDVIIYKVPEQYSILKKETANNHRRLINEYTPYKSVIIYTYENFRPMPNDGRLLEEYCLERGIDACWNPFTPAEKNDQMLIDILGFYKL